MIRLIRGLTGRRASSISLAAFVSLMQAASAASCVEQHCQVGDVVKTWATKHDNVFWCPTEALDDYANFIVGLWALQTAFNGRADADVDRDATGDTAAMISDLRGRAGVETFEEAVSGCQIGRSDVKATVMHVSIGAFGSVKIAPTNGSVAFWAQMTHIQRLTK